MAPIIQTWNGFLVQQISSLYLKSVPIFVVLAEMTVVYRLLTPNRHNASSSFSKGHEHFCFWDLQTDNQMLKTLRWAFAQCQSHVAINVQFTIFFWSCHFTSITAQSILKAAIQHIHIIASAKKIIQIFLTNLLNKTLVHTLTSKYNIYITYIHISVNSIYTLYFWDWDRGKRCRGLRHMPGVSL